MTPWQVPSSNGIAVMLAEELPRGVVEVSESEFGS